MLFDIFAKSVVKNQTPPTEEEKKVPRDIVKKSLAVKKLNDALANCEQTFTYSAELTELDFFSHLTNLLLDFETPEALMEMVEADETTNSRVF